MDNDYIEKILMENNENFECLVILPNSIKDISWLENDYLDKLLNLNIFKSIQTNQDNFIEFLATNLNVDKFQVKNMNVKTEIVGEEPNYVFELMYIDLEKENQYHTDDHFNEMASLINTNGDKIYSNAILFRNYLPSFTDSMTLCNTTKNDLKRLLYDRVHTKIVTWDEGWKEQRVVGDLNNFANDFFDGEEYKKIELGFLMHNINIWYTTFDLKSKDKSLCGKIINKPIDKCIWFTMKSDEYRGNLSLDEVNKIIYLSNVLPKYNTPPEFLEDKIDNMGRKIIYNKYKVLDHVFDKNK